jgi:hypothetical protein
MMMTLKMKNSNRQITELIQHLMQRDDSRDAAADSVNWAKNLFRARAAEPKMSLVKKVMAVLQIDLSPQRAAFGERSAGASAVRQMLFDAGDNSIDLRIREDNRGGLEIHGQILGAGFAGGEVELMARAVVSMPDGKSFKSRLTETSEFKLTGLAATDYVFTARGDEKELVIENLDLE